MKNWEDVQLTLNNNDISADDQELVRGILLSSPFKDRQMLMGILLAFPEKIEFFVNLIKKKKELKESQDADLASEILDMETTELDKLLGELS